MRKCMFFLCSAVFLLSSIGLVSSISAEGREANSLQQYAKQHAVDDMLDTVRAEDHEDFHLSSSENIEVGKFYQSWGYAKGFVRKKSDKLKQSDQWYAAVYQDGKPVNVMAASRNENGKYSIMGIGFGKDLAIALDKRGSNGGKLIYEFPTDAWFDFYQGRVSAVNDAAKKLIGDKKLKFSDFQDFVYERYKDPQIIMEGGQNTAVGGGNSGASYEEVIDNNSSSSFFLYLGSASVILLGTYFFIRKRASRTN